MTTKEGKCLTFCIMTGVGIVDEDTRKLKKDEFVDYVKVPTKVKVYYGTKKFKVKGF